MRFRILGPVEVESDDGRVHTLSRQQERTVLAILLLNPRRGIPVDRLVTLLWDDNPPGEPRQAVHSHVSRIRRLLADAGAADHDIALVSHRSGYLLRIDPDLLDAHRFRRLLTTAQHTAELTERDKLLHDALALWRGPTLNRPPSDPLRQRLCADLDELHLQAQEELLATGIDLGRHHEALADLAQLSAEHPGRQRLTELHMLALHLDGRTTDALYLYQHIRGRLADELGLDPNPTLQRLHTAILRGEPGSATETTDTAPSTAARTAVPAPVVPAQLPADVPSFAGRTHHLDQLDALLPDPDTAEAAAVVITAIDGTAGIGKTALAVHWAHQVRDRFPDGQLYVNLRGFDPGGQPMDPATAVRGFLEAIETPAVRIPTDPDAQAAQYRSLLVDKRMLIVLDNARDSTQIRPLLPGAPGCLVVVTSRNQLTSLIAETGAHPLTLDLLTDQEAYDLLAHRLSAERIAAEADAVAEIITRCARLPLALTLVAAHATLRSRTRLQLLAAQLRDAQQRWHTLAGDDPATDVQAVFSWSYQTLTPDAARLFRLLGLHPGPDIGVPAAASLTALPIERVRPLLTELSRANLLTESTPGRYSLHDLLRAYAAHLTHTEDAEDQRRAAAHRILDHYLHTAYAADRLLHPARDPLSLTAPQPGITPQHFTDYEQALNWFTTEHPVLVAAVDHAAATGFDTHTWQLARSLRTFLDLRGYRHDLATVGSLAVAAAGRLADPTTQAHAHRALARAHILLGHLDDAHTHLCHALDLTTQTGDQIEQANTHNYLAHLRQQQGNLTQALHHARHALDLHRAAGHQTGQAYALNTIGWCHAQLGDHQQALTSCQQALPLFQNLGNRDGQAYAWDALGYTHHHLGQHTHAISCYQNALTLLQHLGDRYGEATTLIRLGDTHHATANPTGAGAAWQHALDILDDLNHPDADTLRTKLACNPPCG